MSTILILSPDFSRRLAVVLPEEEAPRAGLPQSRVLRRVAGAALPLEVVAGTERRRRLWIHKGERASERK